jgi:hypothetical protein
MTPRLPHRRHLRQTRHPTQCRTTNWLRKTSMGIHHPLLQAPPLRTYHRGSHSSIQHYRYRPARPTSLLLHHRQISTPTNTCRPPMRLPLAAITQYINHSNTGTIKPTHYLTCQHTSNGTISAPSLANFISNRPRQDQTQRHCIYQHAKLRSHRNRFLTHHCNFSLHHRYRHQCSSTLIIIPLF